MKKHSDNAMLDAFKDSPSVEESTDSTVRIANNISSVKEYLIEEEEKPLPAYMEMWVKGLSLNGRTSLSRFWIALATHLAINGIIILIGFLTVPRSVASDPQLGIMSGFTGYYATYNHYAGLGKFVFYFNALALFPILTMTVRRIHDMKHPAKAKRKVKGDN